MTKPRLLFLISSISSLFSLNSYAFPCIFTVMKDSCWINYDVTVVIKDIRDDKPMLSVTVPKGKPWVRQRLDTCKAGQILTYSATFSPKIWEGDETTTFYVHQTWDLPKEVKPKETAWEVRICFPEIFAKVPLPPKAQANCSCNFDAVPAIEPLS